MKFRPGVFVRAAVLFVLSCVALSACEDRAQLDQNRQIRAVISDYMGEANCRRAHPVQKHETYQRCLDALRSQEIKRARDDGW
jgi:hypothetical protein